MRFLFAVLLVSLFASCAFAAQGNHAGEQNCMEYSIAYLNPVLFTNYSEYGYYNVPGYFIGMPMNYKITLSNKCSRVFENLRVIGVQTEFDGTLMDGQNWSESAPHWNGINQTFFIQRLESGQNVSLYARYFSRTGRPGLDKTRLIAMHWAAKNPETLGTSNTGRIIIDDPKAGIWCPP